MVSTIDNVYTYVHVRISAKIFGFCDPPWYLYWFRMTRSHAMRACPHNNYALAKVELMLMHYQYCTAHIVPVAIPLVTAVLYLVSVVLYVLVVVYV